MEMHVFFSGTLCGGPRQQREPSEPSPMCILELKHPVSPAIVWGEQHQGSGTLGLALCTESLHLELAKAVELPWGGPREAGVLLSERQLENAAHVLFPEHLVLYGLAAVSAKGPSGAQLPMPVRGLHLGAKMVGLFLSLRYPVGPGLAKCGDPDFNSSHALKA